MRNLCFRILGVVFAILTLASCDLSTPTSSTDNAVIPSNFKRVSYSQLPGWRDDDVRYALQAFRNSCRAKIQYVGRVIPDKELFAEKCRMLPSASADVATVRAWFESHFQPYQIFNDNGGDRGTYTGYYSPVIPGCRTKTAQCNEPLMGIPTDGRGYKGVPKKDIVEKKIGRVLYWANVVDVQNIQIQG
ncbi:MAG: MltA domain-containing protein, partial [Alphaproteobacteria bacterium]|nr:MltA domain-containing protein [Alphaproteobacteria bacterium]